MISLNEVRREKHREQIDNVIDGLLRDKSLVEKMVDGERRLFTTAGSHYEQLLDSELDEVWERELVYELESRGLLRLSRLDDGDWVWALTNKGRKSVLASYDTALPDAWSALGLEKIADRHCDLKRLLDETGLYE